MERLQNLRLTNQEWSLYPGGSLFSKMNLAHCLSPGMFPYANHLRCPWRPSAGCLIMSLFQCSHGCELHLNGYKLHQLFETQHSFSLLHDRSWLILWLLMFSMGVQSNPRVIFVLLRPYSCLFLNSLPDKLKAAWPLWSVSFALFWWPITLFIYRAFFYSCWISSVVNGVGLPCRLLADISTRTPVSSCLQLRFHFNHIWSHQFPLFSSASVTSETIFHVVVHRHYSASFCESFPFKRSTSPPSAFPVFVSLFLLNWDYFADVLRVLFIQFIVFPIAVCLWLSSEEARKLIP